MGEGRGGVPVGRFLEERGSGGDAESLATLAGKGVEDRLGNLGRRPGDGIAQAHGTENLLLQGDVERLIGDLLQCLLLVREPEKVKIGVGYHDILCLSTDPTTHIDTPKLGRRLPKLLEEEEVEALIDAARSREGPEGLRLVALLELFYATGLRVSELAGLPMSALGADRTTLTVRGKGGKERMVPVGGPARAALAAWLGVRPFFILDPSRQRWLFPSRGSSGYLTRPRVAQLLKGQA